MPQRQASQVPNQIPFRIYRIGNNLHCLLAEFDQRFQGAETSPIKIIGQHIHHSFQGRLKQEASRRDRRRLPHQPHRIQK
jgi:hypothetical protein